MKLSSKSTVCSFKFGIYLALGSCLLISAVANAQGVPVSISGIELTPSANNPAPGQSITITAKSYSTDINAAKVTWTVNGAVKQSAIGAATLTVQAPAIGKKLNVAVTAIATDGRQLNSSIIISPGSVDMIIETDGYTPPVFSGKILPVYQNNVTVIAVPHLADATGKEINPATLVYKWKKDDTVLEDQSGYGKQSVTIAGSIVPRPYMVTVDVSSRDGTLETEGIIQITPQAPSLEFYVDDPLFGPLYNKAIVNSIRIGNQKETSVLSAPYGFDNASSNDGSVSPSNISLNWSVNGSSHPELAAGKSIVLRVPDGQAGSSNIGLQVTSVNDILQSATLGFSAIFSANSASSSTPQVSF